ncbi:hypothetical protein [Nocardia australiensis]|nr:hypothetical protein [Nocardia australiensis]
MSDDTAAPAPAPARIAAINKLPSVGLSANMIVAVGILGSAGAA